jgi:hypothetical protein
MWHTLTSSRARGAYNSYNNILTNQTNGCFWLHAVDSGDTCFHSRYRSLSNQTAPKERLNTAPGSSVYKSHRLKEYYSTPTVVGTHEDFASTRLEANLLQT